MGLSQKELYNNICRTSDLSQIQKYVEDVLNLRGFNNQTPQDKILLLTEEVGELAKAVRKKESKIAVDFDRIQHYDTVESEIADVFIVLLSLCNIMKIDLNKVFLEKEMVNIEREWKKASDK